jgi:hypothetical protein
MKESEIGVPRFAILWTRDEIKGEEAKKGQAVGHNQENNQATPMDQEEKGRSRRGADAWSRSETSKSDDEEGSGVTEPTRGASTKPVEPPGMSLMVLHLALDCSAMCD